MLHADRDAVSFRHELARLAIEDALAPHRRLLLHRRALAVLAAAPRGRADPARLAHHAEAAGDGDAVLRHAPAAAERAAAVGAHREAAEQFARALRFADALAPDRRAELLERRSYECCLTDRIRDAIDARRRALEERRAAGDRRREGDAHRWLSRLAWFEADNATAEEEARSAVELLEALAPGRELAMAYSNTAHIRMLSGDDGDTARWGERAIELAERLQETEILAHALNNLGTAELRVGSPAGREKLESSSGANRQRGRITPRGLGKTRGVSASLQTSVEMTSGTAVLDVRGELDVTTAPDLCHEIEAAAADRRRVVVDLSGVTDCDAGGLRALVGTARELEIRLRQLVMRVAPRSALDRLVAVTGMREFLRVEGTRDVALDGRG